MNLSMKDSDFGPIIVNMYGGGQERGPTVSVYIHLENPLEALSWFVATFQAGHGRSCQN